MKYAPALPADFLTWHTGTDKGFAAARRDVEPAVRAALAQAHSLYDWAASRTDKDVFHGRGETFGIELGPVRAVVRHARRGGLLRFINADRFYSRQVRFLHEIRQSRKLLAKGIRTPAVLAGVAYPSGLAHTADIATERLDGRDLAAVFFGPTPPTGIARAEALAAVGAAVRKLHGAGFLHPDLQLRNVLLLNDGEVAFLDVDTCREISPTNTAMYRGNLGRFLRSWAKWNAKEGTRLTAGDRRAFLAAYDPTLAP